MARQDDYTRARVDRIYDAIFGIFNLSPNPKKFDKSWQELRKNLSPEQVKEFYVFIKNLWPENMELDDFVPKPRKNKLRALYIGRETAWNINSKISRYSLYTDEIIVPIPILNPKIIRPDYNPIYKPGMYLQQTLENIGFMINMLPWYITKKVRLIPNPISYNRPLHEFIFNPQRAAQKESEYDAAVLNDIPQDVEEDMKDQMMRMYLSIPDEHIDEWVKGNFKNEEKHSQSDITKYIREQRQKDPFLLLKNYTGGEMKWMTLGSTSDVGTYIAQKAGAFLYTDNSLQWKQILSEASSSFEGSWSNLTHDFQALDFKFLDNVDSKFASEIVAEGRLELFRNFLRDLRKEIINSNSIVDDSTTREFSDRLKIAFNEAQKDWDAIDKKLIKWMSASTGTAGLISTLAQGTLNPMIPVGGFAVNAALQIVDSTRTRKHFKRTVPMAVLIDLKKKKRKML